MTYEDRDCLKRVLENMIKWWKCSVSHMVFGCTGLTTCWSGTNGPKEASAHTLSIPHSVLWNFWLEIGKGERRWHHPYGRKQRGTKEPLNEGERGEWKSWLKTQHSKTKIMASSIITPWQIDGETMETVIDFIFLDCKITADGDCRLEIKRCFPCGRKVMTNLDNILKSSNLTLPIKV